MEIPKQKAIVLDIKNEKQAKEMLLVFNSHYSEINQEMIDFFDGIQLDDILTFRIDDMFFSIFCESETEIPKKLSQKKAKKCPNCGAEI
jgi:hypothetical protein